jgi:hypothetical protein
MIKSSVALFCLLPVINSNPGAVPKAALQPATPPPPLERGSPDLDDYFDAPPDAVKQTLMNAIGMYSAAQWQASQAPLAVKLLDDMRLLAHIEMVHVRHYLSPTRAFFSILRPGSLNTYSPSHSTQNVYCMGDGHTMSTFCDDLFSAVRKQTTQASFQTNTATHAICPFA